MDGFTADEGPKKKAWVHDWPQRMCFSPIPAASWPRVWTSCWQRRTLWVLFQPPRRP